MTLSARSALRPPGHQVPFLEPCSGIRSRGAPHFADSAIDQEHYLMGQNATLVSTMGNVEPDATVPSHVPGRSFGVTQLFVALLRASCNGVYSGGRRSRCSSYESVAKFPWVGLPGSVSG